MKENNQKIKDLFSKPLPSSRSGAFYNTFPYPTKISPESIAVYIACSTQPGETVLDSFAGSGSTGIAAILCEHPTEKMLEIAEQLDAKPIWGMRNAVLYEIGTYASFATKTLTNRLKSSDYSRVVNDFIAKAEDELESLYTAVDPCGNKGIIRYAIWTEILVCPSCGQEIPYFENGTTRNPVTFANDILCPHCNKFHSVSDLAFVSEEYFDKVLQKTSSRKKRKLAWVYGTTNGKNWDRAATTDDEIQILEIEREFEPIMTPRAITWGDLHRSGYHYGITHLHHFYTIRNYVVMSRLWKLAESYPDREADALKLLLLSYNAAHCTLMTRVVAKQNAKDFVLTSAQSGVLYISKLPVEKNILLGLKRKSKPFEDAYRLLENCSGQIDVRNMSSAKMVEENQSIDFVFTDPPFGDFIPYSEVNQINELWLPAVTKQSEEIIISNSQSKDVDTYRNMLASVFSELGRVVKDGHHIAVVFHAAKASVWQAFSTAVQISGLEITHSSILDKVQSSFKQVVSKSSVQGDPLFLLSKQSQTERSQISDADILKQIISTTPHHTDIEIRHCYSLYIGKCLENDITVCMDAKQVYDFIAEQRR